MGSGLLFRDVFNMKRIMINEKGRTKKFLLSEEQIPTAWYNIGADMIRKPAPMLHPATKMPLTPEDLYPIFAEELSRQELNTSDAYIEIPDRVRELYKIYRPTPLVRATELEKNLDTPAHIYFKNESVSPVGSHKLNSAIAQAYYCHNEGITNVTTETGAGQWGMALSYASRLFGLETAVYQVKVTHDQKPYRRMAMESYGASVTASPSMSTRAGKDVLTQNPLHPGSLGIAISEALELARGVEKCKYTLGSVLNHVSLHQTVIGEETIKQMEMAGEDPDILIGCFGGGSNFGGFTFPFIRQDLSSGQPSRRYIAAEPESCPKLTKGAYRYDHGDEAGYTPLIPMYTLGKDFVPSSIHAGGLRFHGAGAIVSQLLKDGFVEAQDIPQSESFRSGLLFARTEGIIPAPESCHAIAVAIREALKAKEAGEKRVIVFNLSGHGLIDMPSYSSYLQGEFHDSGISSAEIAQFTEGLLEIPEV